MKRYFFSLLCCLVLLAVSLSAYAQNAPVAMLEHAGTVKSYDGSNGFVDAYKDAVEGDMIVLSPGNFVAPDTINKKHVNIRGNGGRTHGEEANPTTVSARKNNIYFFVDSIYVEGVAFMTTVFNRARHSSFVKCIFASTFYGFCEIGVTQYIGWDNTFLNCRFSDFYDNGFSDDVTQRRYYNCIFDKYNASSSYGSGNYYNCMIVNTSSNPTMNAVTFYDNCIFYAYFGGNYFANNQCSYCIAYDTYGINPFSSSYSNTNTYFYYSSNSTIFKDFTGSNNSIPTEYILTDEAAAKYLGPDGTQIGVHGGTFPFDYEVSAAHVVKMDVSPNVANGKLTVKVKMSTDGTEAE